MEQANLSIEEILKQVQASLAETRLGVGEQIRAAVSQAEDRMKSEFEERLNDAAATAAAAAATLQHEQEIRAAISQAEEKSKDRIEKLEADVAEAQKDEDVGPRNVVVCIDGTANQFGVKNSNVVELYHLLVKDKRQITFYNSGIGTYAKPSWRSFSYWRQAIGHTIDLMIAWNYERIIQEAYLWLSENYHDGDRIFLFGFSRGAYQVRCLSAMIDTVGLIHRGNDAQIPFAYELYASTGKENSTTTTVWLINVFFWLGIPAISFMFTLFYDRPVAQFLWAFLILLKWFVRIAASIVVASTVLLLLGILPSPQEMHTAGLQLTNDSKIKQFQGIFSRICLSTFTSLYITCLPADLKLASIRLLMDKVCKMFEWWPMVTKDVKQTSEVDIGTTKEDVSDDPKEMAKRFKKSFSREVRVHFVGAWDTVSSVGIVRDKVLPGTTSGMKHVTFFRHALALDERRVKFLPEYAYEGSALLDSKEAEADEENRNRYNTTRDKMSSGMKHVRSTRLALPLNEGHFRSLLDEGSSLPNMHNKSEEETRNRSDTTLIPHTKEVWFAGTHSDIGGGNIKNPEMNRSDPPLRWMSYEATAAGLRLEPFAREWELQPKINVHESLAGPWYILECLRLTHLTYDGSSNVTRWFHSGAGRYIKPGQKLHSSVVYGAKHENGSYEPKALLEKSEGGDIGIKSWSELSRVEMKNLPNYVERDLYDRAFELVHDISSAEDHSRKRNNIMELVEQFVSMVSSPDEARALREIPDLRYTLRAGGHLPRDVHLSILRTSKTLFGGDERSDSSPDIEVGFMPSSIASLPGGRQSAVVKEFGNTIEIYSTTDPEMPARFTKTLNGHKSAVLSLSFSFDGAFLASGGLDHCARVWSIGTSESLRVIEHSDVVGSVVLSADGSLVASGCTDGQIDISNVASAAPVVATPLDHASTITSLVFSSNNSLFASGSSDGTIHVCSLSGEDTPGPAIAPLEGHTAGIISLAFSPNCHQLVSGSYDCTIRVWDLQSSDTHVRVLYGHTAWITSLAFSPDGEHIVSGSTDSTCRLWESHTGRVINPPIRPFDEWVSSVNFSPDGMSIIACSIDGVVKDTSIDISDIDRKCLYAHTFGVNCVAFSPDSKHLVSCSADRTTRVWDVQTGRESLRPLEGHTSSVLSVQSSPDGSLIASGSFNRTVRIWDAVTGKQKGEPLRGHTDWVRSVGFSPDGKHLVSGSDDRTVRVWNVETRSEAFKPLEGHTHWVLSVQYSPDGRYIVSGSSDGTVCLWDANTGKEVGEPFHGHDSSVYSVAFSPDGTRIVSGSVDGTILIWDTKTGKAVGEPLRGHTYFVESVAYSPDGKRIASGSYDKTVRVWDAETGKEVFEPLRGHTNSVYSVTWSPDGKLIASASNDKTIRLWNANTGEPIRF